MEHIRQSRPASRGEPHQWLKRPRPFGPCRGSPAWLLSELCLRIPVYLVICDSGWVSLEHLLLLRHPSNVKPSNPESITPSNRGSLLIRDVPLSTFAESRLLPKDDFCRGGQCASGLLTTVILHAAAERRGDTPKSLNDFILKATARIWP